MQLHLQNATAFCNMRRMRLRSHPLCMLPINSIPYLLQSQYLPALPYHTTLEAFTRVIALHVVFVLMWFEHIAAEVATPPCGVLSYTGLQSQMPHATAMWWPSLQQMVRTIMARDKAAVRMP